MPAGLVQIASAQTTPFGLARTYANVRDTITIAARGIGGAATLGVTVPFGEEY